MEVFVLIDEPKVPKQEPDPDHVADSLLSTQCLIVLLLISHYK